MTTAIRLTGMISGDSGGTLLVGGINKVSQDIYMGLQVGTNDTYGTPEFGSPLRELMFEQPGEDMEHAFATMIRNAAAALPYASMIEVSKITFGYKGELIRIHIEFTIINTKEKGSLSFEV